LKVSSSSTRRRTASQMKWRPSSSQSVSMSFVEVMVVVAEAHGYFVILNRDVERLMKAPHGRCELKATVAIECSARLAHLRSLKGSPASSVARSGPRLVEA
jgi:hypothetical protein